MIEGGENQNPQAADTAAQASRPKSSLKSVIVVSWASEHRPMLDVLRQQFAMAQIPLIVHPGGVWHASTELTLKRYQAVAERYSDYEHIVFTDAFDVLFYGEREELVAALANRRGTRGGGAFFAAERNCFPDKYLAPCFADTRTPWRYVNGGLFAGSPGEIQSFCQAIRSRESYGFGRHMLNQQYFNLLLAGRDGEMRIDSDGAIFYCMQQENEGPVLLHQAGRPFNALTGTRPMFIHFNGNYPAQDFLLQQELSRLKNADERALLERIRPRVFKEGTTVPVEAPCR